MEQVCGAGPKNKVDAITNVPDFIMDKFNIEDNVANIN